MIIQGSFFFHMSQPKQSEMACHVGEMFPSRYVPRFLLPTQSPHFIPLSQKASVPHLNYVIWNGNWYLGWRIVEREVDDQVFLRNDAAIPKGDSQDHSFRKCNILIIKQAKRMLSPPLTLIMLSGRMTPEVCQAQKSSCGEHFQFSTLVYSKWVLFISSVLLWLGPHLPVTNQCDGRKAGHRLSERLSETLLSWRWPGTPSGCVTRENFPGICSSRRHSKTSQHTISAQIQWQRKPTWKEKTVS